MATAAARHMFEVLPDEDDEPAAQAARASASTQSSAAVQGAAVAGVMLALKALSQRALIAAADMFCLVTVGSAFWLWTTIPDPNPHQLTGLGMYATFVLAANLIVRKKR